MKSFKPYERNRLPDYITDDRIVDCLHDREEAGRRINLPIVQEIVRNAIICFAAVWLYILVTASIANDFIAWYPAISLDRTTNFRVSIFRFFEMLLFILVNGVFYYLICNLNSVLQVCLFQIVFVTRLCSRN